MKLDAAFLWRTAAVVGKRRDVFDSGYFEAGVLEIEDGLFASCAGAFDFDFDLDHAVLAGFVAGFFGGAAGGERGGFTGALEADGSGGGPTDGLTVGVGDGDHGVVEGRLDVGDAAGDAFAE